MSKSPGTAYVVEGRCGLALTSVYWCIRWNLWNKLVNNILFSLTILTEFY